ELEPWNDFLRAYAGIDAEAGTVAVFAEVEADEGRIDGYLKPLVEDLDVLRLDEEGEEQNALQSTWEAVVGATAELFQNQPTDRLATRVPIQGAVDSPDTPFWPVFVNVLRNAFVEAFAPRLGAPNAGSRWSAAWRATARLSSSAGAEVTSMAPSAIASARASIATRPSTWRSGSNATVASCGASLATITACRTRLRQAIRPMRRAGY